MRPPRPGDSSRRMSNGGVRVGARRARSAVGTENVNNKSDNSTDEIVTASHKTQEVIDDGAAVKRRWVSGVSVVQVEDHGRYRFPLGMKSIVLVLVIFLALLVLVPNMLHYLQQKEQIKRNQVLKAQLLAENQQLREQIALWDDPNYIASMAHSRLGYVMPGEKLYIVEDPGTVTGEVNTSHTQAKKYQEAIKASTPWYKAMLTSIDNAGSATTYANEAEEKQKKKQKTKSNQPSNKPTTGR